MTERDKWIEEQAKELKRLGIGDLARLHIIAMFRDAMAFADAHPMSSFQANKLDTPDPTLREALEIICDLMAIIRQVEKNHGVPDALSLHVWNKAMVFRDTHAALASQPTVLVDERSRIGKHGDLIDLLQNISLGIREQCHHGDTVRVVIWKA